MANEQNLRPCEYKLSREEAKKGGERSGETRRKRKGLKNTIEWLLSLPLNSGESVSEKDIMAYAQLKGQNVTIEEAITLAQVQRALKGDPRAFELLRDTAGEKQHESRQDNQEALDKLDEVLKNLGGVV